MNLLNDCTIINYIAQYIRILLGYTDVLGFCFVGNNMFLVYFYKSKLFQNFSITNCFPAPSNILKNKNGQSSKH